MQPLLSPEDVSDEQIKRYRESFIRAQAGRMTPFARDGRTHALTARDGLTAPVCGHGDVCTANPYLVDCPDCGGRQVRLDL